MSVSLPTWSANVGYEEGEDWVINRMTTGYPRCVMPLTLTASRSKERLADMSSQLLHSSEHPGIRR